MQRNMLQYEQMKPELPEIGRYEDTCCIKKSCINIHYPTKKIWVTSPFMAPLRQLRGPVEVIFV